MSQIGMPNGATLLLGDGQKRLINPQFRQKERKTGLLPKNDESPFGQFPKHLKSQTSPTSACSPKSPHMSTPTHAHDYVRKKTGNGGKTSSKLHVTPPSAKGPSKCGAFKPQKIEPSKFRLQYLRGDIPVALEHNKTGSSVNWKVEIPKLDYHYYLPLFFDGLREKEDPFRVLAVQGTIDLLTHPDANILPVVPQLIMPIKEALNTKDPEVVANVIKIIETMLKSNPLIGEALVPYYKQILPVFNLFVHKNANLGDKFEYSQRMRQNLGDLIDEVLAQMEKTGGENAFKNIKYMVPTYQSVVYW